MFSIKDILDRYQNISLPDETLRKEAILIIKELTGIDLNLGQVKVKNQELIIEASPIIKSSIYIKRQKILAELINRLGKKAPLKVR